LQTVRASATELPFSNRQNGLVFSVVTAVTNPALEEFVTQIGSELAFAQVLISRDETGFELRHVADRSQVRELLKPVPVPRLRELALFNESGAFRPLRSAPDLQSGWRTEVKNGADLGLALNHLYPAAIADWYARRKGAGVTNYRDFTGRQSGMYRVTQLLSDEQAWAAIRACCHRQFCLKQRLWTVEGLDQDAAECKSLIPCLEPCAVMLEFARTATRIEQAEKADCQSSALTLLADTRVRVADFSAPDNPRRVQLLLEKARPAMASSREHC
jgi:hypothetical protein